MPATARTSIRHRLCWMRFTIRQRKGRLEGLKVAIIGDIAHSRVARSNVHLLTKFGSHVWLCSAPTLMPPGIEQIICEKQRTVAPDAFDGRSHRGRGCDHDAACAV